MTIVASTFDHAAAAYEQQLHMGLSLSGESADYFIRGRVAMLSELMMRHAASNIASLVDFGCGVGNAAQALLDLYPNSTLVGIDCSRESLAEANRRYSHGNLCDRLSWSEDTDSLPDSSVDLVYTSGVMHHIPPADRNIELSRLRSKLRPGGLMAVFENNPWNPGTRWVMSRIPFDQDAVCLSSLECARRLKTCGFEVLDKRYLFFFPRWLAILRPIERQLSRIPLGAQYVVFARRPAP